MGKYILAFIAGPRQSGHSNKLMGELIGGARSKGAEVTTYDLNNPGLRGCQSCFYCRTHPICPIDDYLKPVYEEMENAAAVVLSSPIYFADITGQAKMWLDRMFPMLDGESFRPRHPGKKAVTLFSQGDGNPERFEASMAKLHGFFRTFGWNLAGTLICHGTSAPGFEIPGELLEKARKIGEALATN